MGWLMKNAKRIVYIIGIAVLLAIVVFIANLYFTLSGGVPWVKVQAQARMVTLLKDKYPNLPFHVSSNAMLDFKDKHFSIGIVFKSEPSNQFFYELNSFKPGGNDYYFHANSTDTIDFLTAGPAPGADRLKWINKYRGVLPKVP